MVVHDLGDDREAEARAGAFGGDEGIKNPFAVRFGDARSCIFHDYFDAANVFRGAWRNCDMKNSGAAGHGFVGVECQVDENLLAKSFIEQEFWDSGGVVALYGDPCLGVLVVNRLQRPIHHGRHILRAALQRLRSGEVEKTGQKSA